MYRAQKNQHWGAVLSSSYKRLSGPPWTPLALSDGNGAAFPRNKSYLEIEYGQYSFILGCRSCLCLVKVEKQEYVDL